MSLSALDATLFQGSDRERAQFAEALVESCRLYGFAKIVNHGIPDQVISELFSWSRKFFQLPTDSKKKIAHPPGPDPQRGWSCVGAERTARLYGNGINATVDEDLVDSREHFDQGSSLDENWPNRWPEEEELPGFRRFMEDYYERYREVTLYLLEAFELGLRLRPKSLTSKITHKASEVRLNHYPDIDVNGLRGGNISRIWPHTDLGVMTCLFQDGSGGLEMEDREKSDSFIPITSDDPSEMILNISETFQRWTNDQLKAGVHRVTIPPQFKDLDYGVIPSRYSSACFVKADRDALVGPLEEFLDEKDPAMYDSITALEFHHQRVASAYKV